MQSQYFQKAFAEALKATGKVWFFILHVYIYIHYIERVERIWIVLNPEPIYSPRAETAAKKFFLITPVVNNDFWLFERGKIDI